MPEPEDLLSFGMIPEFIGRLPVLTTFDPLTEDELMLVLTEPKNAMVKQYNKLFAMEGANLTVTRDALRALAAQAVKKGTGARALRSLLERLMLDVMYDLPSREDIADVTINRAVVEGRKRSADPQEAGSGRGVVLATVVLRGVGGALRNRRTRSALFGDFRSSTTGQVLILHARYEITDHLRGVMRVGHFWLRGRRS